MKRDDFRITIEWYYPDLKSFIKDFNAFGGNITIDELKCHLEYPSFISDGWLNAYNIFFKNKFHQELILVNSIIGDDCRMN